MVRYAVVALAAHLLACSTPAILNVPVGPDSPYPCGPTGVVCATQHTCCGEYDTCGGEPGSVGCPAGACCYIGPESDDYNRATWSELAAPTNQKQTPQAR
jgi:hypothetical protein